MTKYKKTEIWSLGSLAFFAPKAPPGTYLDAKLFLKVGDLITSEGKDIVWSPANGIVIAVVSSNHFTALMIYADGRSHIINRRLMASNQSCAFKVCNE